MGTHGGDIQSFEMLERVVCVIASIAVLICTTMILLYIRDIENITGGPEAYEDSDCYKMAAWLLAAVSIVGMILHPVLRTVHYHYVKSYMNNDVTFGYIKAGVVIIIAVLLLVGTVANVMYASANTNIMKSVMAIMSHDHSIFTTSEDKELYNALRRVRNAEVVTAIFSFLGVVAFTSVAVMIITNASKQMGANWHRLFIRCNCLLTNCMKQLKHIVLG